MSPRHFLIAALLTLFVAVVAAEPAKPESTSRIADGIPRLGIGSYFIAGLGSNGASAVPGLTILAGPFPIKAHLGLGDGVVDIVTTVDWLPLEYRIGTTNFSLFAGPGLYTGYSTLLGSSAFTAFAVGGRAVFGGRTLLFDSYELYSTLTPAFGYGLINGSPINLWNVDFEIGLRYLFPLQESTVRQALLPHPAFSQQPPLAALSPSGAAGSAALAIAVTNKRFAPGTDGKFALSSLKISSKSRELLSSWKLEVLDPAGTAFYTQEGEGAPPDVLDWDGKGNEETFASPGASYPFTLSVTDSLGTSQSRSGVFETDFVHPALSLQTDLTAFSPSGAPRVITITPGPENVEAVVSWKLAILGKGGQVAREFGGKGSVPEGVLWDGRNFLALPLEGIYTARLSVTYLHGDKDSVTTEPFELVTTPPKPIVALANRHFLPDGDGIDETQIFKPQANNRWPTSSWSLAISDSNSHPLISWEGDSEPPEAIEWNGVDQDGATVPFGTDFNVVLSTTDSLGRVATRQSTLPVDLPRALVALSSAAAFSPSGTPSVLAITASPSPPEGLATWRLDILDEQEEILRTLAGKGSLPKDFAWDGKNSKGVVVDGTYTGRLSLVYDRGEEAISDLPAFLLDNNKLTLSASLPPEFAFTPDSDGVDDVIGFTTDYSGATAPASWTFDTTDPKGKPFSHTVWEGDSANPIPWDGRSTGGEIVLPEQRYGYSLRMTDSLGKSAVSKGQFQTGALINRDGDDNRLGSSGTASK
ncbi:MAG: hypothetical protein ACOYM2_01170 [Rectinemataceae bacterium]